MPAVEIGSSINLQIPAPHSTILKCTYTNPEQYKQVTQQANARYNFEFKPLVRILKLWNVKNGRPYSSCTVEYHLATTCILGNNLEDYFYSVVSNLPVHFLPNRDKIKVKEFKEQVALKKSYHDLKIELVAEKIIQRLLPL